MGREYCQTRVTMIHRWDYGLGPSGGGTLQQRERVALVDSVVPSTYCRYFTMYKALYSTAYVPDGSLSIGFEGESGFGFANIRLLWCFLAATCCKYAQVDSSAASTSEFFQVRLLCSSEPWSGD